MKHFIALSVVLFTLIGGTLTAQAGPDGFGIQHPDISENGFGIHYPDSFDNGFGISYPEFP